MTRDQLIAALQEECRADRMKVEDFLHALSDLCAETLEKGESFILADIGLLAVNPRLARGSKKLRLAVIFRPSNDLRGRLKLPEIEIKKRGQDACKSCGRLPRKVRVYDECDPCIHARDRTDKKRRRHSKPHSHSQRLRDCLAGFQDVLARQSGAGLTDKGKRHLEPRGGQ